MDNRMSNAKRYKFEGLSEGPEFLSLSEEEKAHLVSVMEKMLAMGIGAVYGMEEEEEADATVDCKSQVAECRARCCSFHFALTREEVKKGLIRHDPERPFLLPGTPTATAHTWIAKPFVA
jgi:hypothetical protein